MSTGRQELSSMRCVLHNDFMIPCPKFGTTQS